MQVRKRLESSGLCSIFIALTFERDVERYAISGVHRVSMGTRNLTYSASIVYSVYNAYCSEN
jgi:hypothetical protein